MSKTASSPDEVLKRIKQETQRVRRRLTNDSEEAEKSLVESPRLSQLERENQLQAEAYPSVEVSESGVPVPVDLETANTRSSNSAPFVIENSESNAFEDPVPERNMSSHLKSEHEAFKQR